MTKFTVYNKDTVCPFYKALHATTKKEKERILKTIACEGLCDAKFIKLSFGTEKKRNVHAKHYCDTFNYKECPIAQTLIKAKYGGDL